MRDIHVWRVSADAGGVDGSVRIGIARLRLARVVYKELIE